MGKGVMIGALGSVLGGLLLAALSWVFGFHHAIWVWIVDVAQWLWFVLTFPVPVPVIVLAIFAGLGLYVWRDAVLRKRARSTVAPKSREAASTAVEPAPLTDNEVSIVRLLAGADGRWMSISELASRAALAKLVMEQAIDRLGGRGFLRDVSSPRKGKVYRLSPAGRDYAITAGYVRQPILAAGFRR
jgi:hypothetical protein